MKRGDNVRLFVEGGLFTNGDLVHSAVRFFCVGGDLGVLLHAYVNDADVVVFAVKTSERALVVILEIMCADEIR